MQTITLKQNKIIHALLAELGLKDLKSEMIEGVTEGRSTSSRDLTNKEAIKLINQLTAAKHDLTAKTRAKIIHQLCLMGYVKPDGQADYTRITAFIRGIGSHNPKKKNLFQLSPSEINRVCTQVEQMYRKHISKSAHHESRTESIHS